MGDFRCVMVGAVGDVGAIGCHGFPAGSRGLPVGTCGRKSIGVTPEARKSTVAHGKKIAFGDALKDPSPLSPRLDMLVSVYRADSDIVAVFCDVTNSSYLISVPLSTSISIIS